jgi:hypothetical protein
MKEPRNFWGALVAIGLCAGLFLGLKSDLDAMPPVFGSRCYQAYDALWEQAVQKHEPSPVLVNRDIVALAGQDELAIFSSSDLSYRAGFNLTGSRKPEQWAQRLGAGWYIDWQARRRFANQKPEHWQMVRLGKDCIYPNLEAIRWLASHYQGAVWIIGNEPDNIWQDNLPPEDYARIYHDLYAWIKDADPIAKVAVAGVTQGTPLRLAYLDRVLAAYQANYQETMPTDWWTVHGFVLREERGSWGAEIPTGFGSTQQGALYEPADVGSLAHFQELVLNFRSWMAARGYRDTPLAITEFGILASVDHGYSPEVVAQYLAETFTWLEQASDPQVGYPGDDDHLVQRWAWFSLYDKLYTNSNLAVIPTDMLTEAGRAFRTFVEERRP